MANEKQVPGEKLIARNKRASFDYELGESYEAGVVLMGSEVKMLRHSAADLTDSWCAVERGEVFLHGVNIPEMPNAAYGHLPKRTRKLLLHEAEIESLQRAVTREGMTIVATRVYFKHGKVKVEIASARGKRKGDKRETIKAKDAERETRAAIARGRRGE